ncbi:phage integrase N-terminal SAM-like domain-containing protein [Halomonas sp. CS7]|uniref:Phage integrase N-terminal SAM-like domain-containing protein n=1 Tax=Halomonas pelophila TaxID=3151122 RepID=A0ABV1N6P3_9GAMM
MHREDGSMDTHSKPPKLMDRVRAILRVKRYSPRTEKTYCYWIRYFIRFHGVRHPVRNRRNRGQTLDATSHQQGSRRSEIAD